MPIQRNGRVPRRDGEGERGGGVVVWGREGLGIRGLTLRGAHR